MTATVLYTPAQAAERLGISRSTLYVLLTRGEIASLHIGRARRITDDALRDFIDNQTLDRVNPWASAAR